MHNTRIKTVVSIIILQIIALFSANAQEYHPLLSHDSIVWNMLYGGDQLGDTSHTQIIMHKDTVEYEGKNYRVVQFFSIFDVPQIGYVREENKRIFYRMPFSIDTAEHLVYDFAIQEKDTFLLDSFKIDSSYSLEAHRLLCEKIDSVRLANGEYRKHYYFSEIDHHRNYPLCLEWAEEIMNDMCLPFAYAFSDPFANYNPTCIFADGSLLYSNGRCYNSVRHESPVNFQLSPNPCHSILSFGLPNEEVKISQIINSEGVAQPADTYTLSYNAVDVSKLTEGLYFIRFCYQGRPYVQKFEKL